ncbi:hypothetical protein L596_021669 [Steinernema carpocapsae]|uniref:Peptidase M14 domain-containing protein n=1 Tax=Steinernema carpocapsae TaxID=34508 RepID=A0A4U5MJJ0_STECR|nr:hypothetical protein L596_021669 [Steinernema carpocapsae]
MRAVVLSALLAIFGLPEALSFDLNTYHVFDDIQEYLNDLTQEHPDLVELIKIGSSHENRSLTVVKLEDKNLKTVRPALWIDAGIHATEWIAPTTALNLIDQVLKHPEILKNVTIYVLPVVNPDGYEWSINKDRFWRRNRRPAECGNPNNCCQGVDLNRNFDSDWKPIPGPCSFTHPGLSPFSEPESRAIRDFLTSTKMQLYLAIHSYGQQFLLPKGIDQNHPVRSLAMKASEALKSVHGREYVVGTSLEITKSTSGGLAKDWAYDIGIPYSYTLELRPNKPQKELVPFCGLSLACGFILHPKEIKATFEEFYMAFTVMAKHVTDEFKQKENLIFT